MNASKRLTHTLLKLSKPSQKPVSSTSKSFHTSSKCLVKRPAQPTRRRVLGQSALGTPLENPPLDVESSLPPDTLLHAAQKSGVINLEPKAIVDFLTEYMNESSSGRPEWEREVCTRHSITPTTLTILAGILRRSPTHFQRLLATKVMLSASKLGSKPATYELLLSSLASSSPLPQTPLRALSKLVSEYDPSALALHGKILKHQGNHAEALEYLEKATSDPYGNINFDGAGEALVDKGLLLLELRADDKSLAHAAFKMAALTLDEPLAYYFLSRWSPVGSPEEKVYLIKAAASGVVGALAKLGELELKTVFEKEGLPKRIEGYEMAGEWTRIAAEGGDQMSGLNLGCMFKSVGDTQGWSHWRGRLDDSSRWSEKTRKAREVWAEKGVDFLEDVSEVVEK